MRRLQSNLAYLASLADRKMPVQIAKGPQYLMPPPLNPKIKLAGGTPGPASESTDVKSDVKNDREEREKYLKDLYKRLQALYPGVDPKREPNAGAGAGAGGRPGGSRSENQTSPSPGLQKTPQMATMSAPLQPQAAATS